MPSSVSDDKPQFPGAHSSFTEKLKFLNKDSYDPIPVYRVMNKMGKIIDDSQDPGLDQKFVEKMYKCMTKLNVVDKIMYESQRQVCTLCINLISKCTNLTCVQL